MIKPKFRITCADTHGMNEDIISNIITIENFLIAAGATSSEYTRVELIKLAVDMKNTEILADLEDDLCVIRESLRKRSKKHDDADKITVLEARIHELEERLLYQSLGEF